ncbi:hypothetical protein [Spiroplasma melliferum]|uniref:hypothetical protein n=1 Tax=Spiroplasma melliferum TaxID=2134 RepID=UPI0015E0BF6A|nr:hypothetical protein [Spiroplasma melliferum]
MKTGGDKPKPEKPQEPPIGSNWKLLDKNTVISEIDNKYYFAIKEDRPGINQWFSCIL